MSASFFSTTGVKKTTDTSNRFMKQVTGTVDGGKQGSVIGPAAGTARVVVVAEPYSLQQKGHRQATVIGQGHFIR